MDIIKEFLDYVLCKYKRVYTSNIRLEKCGDTSYSVFLALNNIDKPLCIGGDFPNDESFFTYLKKEFDNRKLYNSKYFLLQMEGFIDLNGEKLETNNPKQL